MLTIDFQKPSWYKDAVMINQGNLSTNNILRCKVITGGDTTLEGYIGSATFTPKSNKEVNGTCKIVDELNCIVDIHFPSNALEVGLGTVEILLVKGTGSTKVTSQSPTIKYEVWQGITTGNGITSDNRYPILIDLISDVNNAVRVANDASSNATKALNSVNNIINTANETINNTNIAKDKALNAVDNVNKAIAAGTHDLEVKEARDKYTTLGERLNNLDKDLLKAKEMTTSTVVTDSDFVSVEETTNGYFEDIKLEGKTLVNIMPLRLTEWVLGGNVQEGTLGINAVYQFRLNNLPVKPNTLYSYKLIGLPDKYDNHWFHLLEPSANKSTEGTFTSISSIGSSFLHLYPKDGQLFTLEEAKSVKVVLVEGNYKFGDYFEGMKSVGDGVNEIVVSSIKSDGNLCTTDYEVGGVNSENGLDYNYSNYLRTKYFNLPKGQYYVNKLINSPMYIYSYDKGGVYLSNEQLVNGNTLTVKQSCVVRIDINLGREVTQEDLVKPKLIISTNPNTTIDYIVDKKKVLFLDPTDNAWKKPTLREWDSVEKHGDKKYSYNVKSNEYLIVDSDLAMITDYNALDYIGVKKPTDSKYNGNYGNYDTITDSAFTYIMSLVLAWDDVNNIGKFSSQPAVDKLWFGVPKGTTLEQAKTMLVGKRLVYQLAQEKVYECTPIDLISFENETMYMFSGGVISPRTTLKVQSCISNVINTLKEKVSLLEDKLYKTNLANFTVALNTLDTKLRLDNMSKTPL